MKLKLIKSSWKRHLPQLIRPPLYADPEDARIARLLLNILNLIVAMLLALAIIAVATQHSIALAFVALGALVFLSTRWLLHNGKLKTAGVLCISTSWLLATLGSIFYGGVNTPAFSVYLLVLLMNAIILKGSLQRWFFLLTLGSGLLIFLLHNLNVLPQPANMPVPVFDGIVRVSILFFAALILYQLSSSLVAALESARHNEQSSRVLLDDLVKTSISEAYLDKVLSSLNDILIVMDPDLRINRVNQATQTLLGYTEEDLIGKTADTIFTPDALRWLMATHTRPVTGIETTYRKRNGQEIAVSFSGALLHDDLGQVQGLVCAAQDISDRQQTANELRRREELYRTLARSLPDMDAVLFDHDLNVRIAEGNTLIGNPLSVSNSEGQSLQGMVTSGIGDRLVRVCRQALAGEHVTSEWVLQSRTFLVHALPVQNEADGIFGGLLLMQDITAIKQVEANLVQHLENLTRLRQIDGLLSSKLDVPYVLQTALDTAIQSSSARAGAILVLDDANYLSIQQVMGNCAAANEIPVIEEAVASGQAIIQPNCYIIPLISNDKPLGALYLQSIQPFAGDVLPFVESLAMRVATALDNANLYEVAQDQLAQLRQLYERLSRLEQLKTDMIRIAAHDLRSPLGVISGFTEMMLENNDLPVRAEEQAQHIYRASQRMHKLITNILSLDRIEQIDNPANYHKLDLVHLATAVYEDHQSMAGDRQFMLKVSASRARIKGDSPQIHEAIANLITNAIKYTPTDGIIAVRLDVRDQYAIFEVSDNGYGIPEEVQANLFQPFFRAESKETHAVEGIGLGLHLVKNIIERHNGTLHFTSVYGQGSTFGFRLPLTTADTDELITASVAG